MVPNKRCNFQSSMSLGGWTNYIFNLIGYFPSRNQVSLRTFSYNHLANSGIVANSTGYSMCTQPPLLTRCGSISNSLDPDIISQCCPFLIPTYTTHIHHHVLNRNTILQHEVQCVHSICCKKSFSTTSKHHHHHLLPWDYDIQKWWTLAHCTCSKCQPLRLSPISELPTNFLLQILTIHECFVLHSFMHTISMEGDSILGHVQFKCQWQHAERAINLPQLGN